MKTPYLKPTITIVTLFLLFIFASSFSTDGTSNKYLTMWAMTNFQKIVIVYEDGKTEEMKGGGLSARDLISHPLKVTETINNIANKGYELVSTSGDVYVATYLFQKK